MPERDEHPEFVDTLTMLLRSSCGIAHSNVSLQRALEATNAATKRRETLKRDARGDLKPGRVLTVRDGRSMVQERERREVERLAEQLACERGRMCDEAMKQSREEIKQGLYERGAQRQGEKVLHEFIN
jgi:hypothetical protein